MQEYKLAVTHFRRATATMAKRPQPWNLLPDAMKKKLTSALFLCFEQT
jgi:hypothetical protein